MEEISKTAVLEAEISTFEDPTKECAGSAVIPASSFLDMIAHLQALNLTQKSEYSLMKFLMEQCKRFTACGANDGDLRTGLIRKNPDSGWKYIADNMV